jgi:hypothetical protein
MLSCESSSTIADVRTSVVCAAAYSFVNSPIRLFTNFRLVGSSMAVHVSPAHAFERRKIKDLIGAFGDPQNLFTALFSPCLGDHCFHVFVFELRYHRRQSKRLDSKNSCASDADGRPTKPTVKTYSSDNATTMPEVCRPHLREIFDFSTSGSSPDKNSMHFYLHERQKLCKYRQSCGYSTPPCGDGLAKVRIRKRNASRYKIYTIMP